MHIAMILDNAFKPDPRVANEARSLVEAGHRVTLIAWDREGQRPRYEDWHGVRVERLAVRSRHRMGSAQAFFLVRFWWAAFWRLLHRRVDVIHCHDFSTLPVGYALAAFKRCRLVYDAHESYADMLAANVAPWIKRLITRTERLICRRADAALTVGDLLAAELRRRGARRTWVVGNWKRLDAFRFAPDVVAPKRAELGFGDRLIVGYIGYLNRDRGLEPLLQAALEHDNVALLIGGDGVLADTVRQAAANCWRIHYLGFVDPTQIPLYTAVSDVVYYGLDASNPNAQYSAPNKLFEALAAGKAVVCNDCGEIGRIVREEQCGIVVDTLTRDTLSQALDALSDPTALAEQQARAADAGARRYNWSQAERELLALYASFQPTA
ncbi:glycosyltransferase family 4 protein, partial [bacterium]|nr:glycosyltransferase family 4 protein [bacterium]